VYQRHLETFDEKPVLRNEAIGHGCMNCHTPFSGVSGRFAISLRGRNGTPTFLVDGKQISRVDTKMGYLSWHPGGKLLAFADNAITQFFHLAGPVNRDINDSHSDINLLHVKEGTIEKPAAMATADHNENWPSWAPDGRYLYYCSAPTVAQRDVSRFRYDLMRISYDVDRNQWGKPETVISSAEHHLSAHQPRVSPDGRYLVLTVSESGSFPLFRPNSDLYLLRLENRVLEPLPINSKHTETWHCWSSNGRWLVFGSRGLDGVFMRVMITHVDPAGHFSKPLLLPQEDPAYYDTCLDNFNAPELAQSPIQISEEELARAYGSPGNKAEPTGRQPPVMERAFDTPTEMDKPYP
jgi:dipeptidyl aminopeptidase/acylaminoacyl peptidase